MASNDRSPSGARDNMFRGERKVTDYQGRELRVRTDSSGVWTRFAGSRSRWELTPWHVIATHGRPVDRLPAALEIAADRKAQRVAQTALVKSLKPGDLVCDRLQGSDADCVGAVLSIHAHYVYVRGLQGNMTLSWRIPCARVERVEAPPAAATAR